jgi:hypothetical protein
MKKMKKILSLLFAGTLVFSSVNAQILSEQNVTINVDLQPVLQLNLEGPTQHDFTFSEIRDYYGGITKYGANVLKVSSTVAFDLWAAGISQDANRHFDKTYSYQVGGNEALGNNNLPLTAMELHQFPANPSTGLNCGVANDGAPIGAYSPNHDYSAPFVTVVEEGAQADGNNSIYTPGNSTPYQQPDQVTAVTATNCIKYIAGGDGAAATCSVPPGTYINNGGVTPVLDRLSNAGYYYVMDYRLVPGLPTRFPMHLAANNVNSTEAGIAAAAVSAGLEADATLFINAGMYSMAIKYILAEDQ